MRPLSRPLAAVLLLVILACGEESTAPRVTSVSVSPASATLVASGATQQFSARAEDSEGAVVTGEQVSWRSDDETVATVSPSGLATAVGNGVATISATVSGVSGTALLTILQPQPECLDPETVTLAPGQEAVFGSQECFVIPAGAAGDRYRLAVLRPDSAAAGNVVQATLTLSAVGEAQSAPPGIRAPLAPVPSRLRLDPELRRELERSLEVAAATERFHARLRAEEAELVEGVPGLRLAEAPAGGAAAPARVAAPPKIRIDPRTECAVDARSEKTAILVHESEDLAIYQDSTQRSSSPLATQHARMMADYYRDHGKEVVEAYFGRPTDVDGNGHMVVVVSPDVADDRVAAFVWSGDFLERGGSGCPSANGGEFIFFSLPTIRRMDDGNYQALETLVHEAKHVVSLRNRLRASINAGGVSRFQPLWVEEGTAEIAGNLSSRVALESQGRVPVGGRLALEDLVDGEGRLRSTPENYGILLRMLRTVRYLSSQPNGVVVTPQGAHPDHSIYGTGWHFHRWLGDAYGNAQSSRADSSLFRALADSTVAAGSAGFLAVTGRTFKELFEEYGRAVAVHRTGIEEGARRFTSYDFVSATDILCRPDPDTPGDPGCPAGVDPQPDGLYPWPVTERATAPGTTVPAALAPSTWRGPLGPTGIRIHDFRSDGSTDVQVELEMSAPGSVLLVRIR